MPGGSPSDEPFISTTETFDLVAALRGRIATGATPVAAAAVGRGGPDETLAALAALTGTVPQAAAQQLEVLARLTTIGALDAVIADTPPPAS